MNNFNFFPIFRIPFRTADKNSLKMHCQDVKSLTLNNVNQYQEKDLLQLIEPFSKLTFLKSPGVKISLHHDEQFYDLLGHLQHLEISVRSEVLLLWCNDFFNEIFPALATLYLTGSVGLVTRGVENLLTWFPGLETLHWETFAAVTDTVILRLAQGLPRLRCLQLKSGPLASSDGILQFARLRGCALRQLHLTLHHSFRMTHLQQLLLCCPNLTDVEFFFSCHRCDDNIMGQLTDVVLPKNSISSAVLHKLPGVHVDSFACSAAVQLRILRLHDCRHLSFTQIRAVLESCTRLEVLELSLCCCSGMLAMSSAGEVTTKKRRNSVKELQLHFCYRNDIRARNVAKKLLQLCPQIKRLCLKDGVHLDLSDLLRRPLLLLEEVNLLCCSFLPLAAPVETGMLRSLKNISFRECRNVSDEYLQALAELCVMKSRRMSLPGIAEFLLHKIIKSVKIA